MDYGYVRVSTKEQNELRQLIALRDFGIDDKHIYIDKQSGKDFVRTNYKKLIRKIKNGDTIVIKSIDRLGRNYDEILEQWRIITKEKQVAIVVLDMPAEHQTKPRFDWNLDCRYCVTASFLCGSDRTGVYSPATGRRNCCCKTTRSKVWQATKRETS